MNKLSLKWWVLFLLVLLPIKAYSQLSSEDYIIQGILNNVVGRTAGSADYNLKGGSLQPIVGVSKSDDFYIYEGLKKELLIDTTIPAVPTDLTVTAISSTRIDLTWQDNSDNEDGFKIERKVKGESWKEIVLVGTNHTTYSDSGLTPLVTYYYRVRAYNPQGDSDYSNEASAAPPPEPIRNLFDVSNYPNPFTPEVESTIIHYRLKEKTRVRIKIYDSIGELVREFDSPPGEAGTANEVTWDGKNGEGEERVGMGVYFCVIEAGGRKEMVKIAVE